MKRAIVFLLWASAVFASGQAVPASSNHGSDEQAIRQLNQDVLKAYNLGDVKTLDRIEDSDFVLTGDFGQVTKAQQLDQVRQRKESASSVRLIIADERFRFYGDAALLKKSRDMAREKISPNTKRPASGSGEAGNGSWSICTFPS